MMTNNEMSPSGEKQDKASRVPAKLIVLLIVTWALLVIRLAAPWYGVQDSYRVWIAASVQNYDRYGLENTGLMVVRNVEPVENLEDLYFYSHHPLVFRNASYIHDYYWLFIVPPMAIAASIYVVNSRGRSARRRLLRPLIDGLIVSFVLASAYELWIMHGVARQPILDGIIEAINTEVSPDDTVLGYVEARGYEAATGHHNVVQFYTSRAIQWDMLYQDALKIVEQTDNPVTYVYCAWEIPEVLEPYPREAFLGDYCLLIRFNGAVPLSG